MIINRLGLFMVFAGGLLAASLGFGLSPKTNTAHLGQRSRSVPVPSTAPLNAEHSFVDYDLAAGDDFFVSATPTHAAKSRTASIDQPEKPGGAVQSGGLCSPSLTPAEDAADSTIFLAGGSSLVALPVDFTLAPGTYSLAVNGGDSVVDNDCAGLFDFVRTSGGKDAFEANPGTNSGFDLTQTMIPAADLANRLYATSVVP